MFEQAEYSGRSEILQKMASFTISQDALDIVQKIGPSKFIKLAKNGKIYLFNVFIRQYAKWFLECPESVKRKAFSIFNKDELEIDEETCLTAISNIISMIDIEDYIENEFLWYEIAPEIFKYIMKKALDDPDIMQKNPLVIDAIENYLGEAYEVAEAAELL